MRKWGKQQTLEFMELKRWMGDVTELHSHEVMWATQYPKTTDHHGQLTANFKLIQMLPSSKHIEKIQKAIEHEKMIVDWHIKHYVCFHSFLYVSWPIYSGFTYSIWWFSIANSWFSPIMSSPEANRRYGQIAASPSSLSESGEFGGKDSEIMKWWA